MKELHGNSSELAAAPPEQCLSVLGDVEGYPRWYPEVVRGVEILERDGEGTARRVRATLHVAVGPLARDLGLTLEVTRGTCEVKLLRVPHEPSDGEHFSVHWRVAGERPGTRIDLVIEAALDVPRFLPLPPSVGKTVADGFVAAAVRELSG